MTQTNPKSPQKSRTFTLSALDIPNKGSKHRSLLLNNTAIQYIPDTGAAISVISEEVTRILNIEIKPYDKIRIKAITADGKEVKDILGFAVDDILDFEADVTLGNQTLEKVRMLVFKNSTNPCLLGRDVLAVHLETKTHFEALMSNNEQPAQQSCKDLNDELREYLRTGKVNQNKFKQNTATEAATSTATK